MSDIIYPDGLIESTQDDLLVFSQCFSAATPFTAMWRDANNDAKFMRWDSAWVDYLQHRQRLIEREGRIAYFPWYIYRHKRLQWANGFAPNQGQIGTCALLATMNSLNTSNLTNALRKDISKPPEVNSSVAYAAARGNGTLRWGSGANLNPLSRWVAEIGNHLVRDVGAYDTAGSALRRANANANTNALKHQSVVIYVPGLRNTPSFGDVFLACSGGFGVCMGTGVYPTAARVGRDGLAVPSAWRNSGHAMCFVAAIVVNGKRYLYLLNSHGNRYDGDKYHDGRQPGCWISEEDFNRMARNSFRYGNWYVNIGEMG